MKWPWVSRAMHESAMEQANTRIRAAENNADWWSSALKVADDRARDAALRYDALLEKFTALRLAGAVVPEPVPLPIERKRDPCAEAILAKAGRDTALQALMFEQLAKDRAAGKNETQILRAIQTGEAPDPWTMPA